MKNPVDGAGDTWTWTAIEADTKLLISHFVGGRDGECAKWFVEDMASRIANRIQLTSDGHKAYLEAVKGAFGADVDYAMVNKIYGASRESAKGRHSPAECVGCRKERIEGEPDLKHVSTSYAERAQFAGGSFEPTKPMALTGHMSLLTAANRISTRFAIGEACLP